MIKYVDQACYLAGALFIAIKGCVNFHKTFMLNPMQSIQLKGKNKTLVFLGFLMLSCELYYKIP